MEIHVKHSTKQLQNTLDFHMAFCLHCAMTLLAGQQEEHLACKN